MSAKQRDPGTALDTIYRTGPMLAKAKAERVYLEEYRKSLKALLMNASTASSAVAKEAAAYADPQYTQHLTALRIAVEEEERLRWLMVVAQASIEVWRSQESSNRMMDRAAA